MQLSSIDRLRRRVRKHNWQVLAFSFLSLAAAVFLWGALYFVAYWVVLFALTVLRGAEAQMPRGFTAAFALAGLALLAVAVAERRWRVNDRPIDKKPRAVIALDFLLSVPRITLAVQENLSAWVSLTPSELALAAHLVDRVRQARKLPLHAAPLEIPEAGARERVILALLMLHVLELRHEEKTAWLRLVQRAPLPAVETYAGARLT